MIFPELRFIPAALLLGLVLACDRAEKPVPAPVATMVAPHADSVGADTCPVLEGGTLAEQGAREPDDTSPPPRHPGSWTETHRVRVDSFSVALPMVVTTAPINERGVYSLSGFPSCRFYCGMSISFAVDSAAQGLDAYVARTRAADSARAEEGWEPGPATPMLASGQHAIFMELPCGDCTTAELLVARGRTIAEVAFSIDDREPATKALACHLTRVARSFMWEKP